jgi:hypothetical protein
MSKNSICRVDTLGVETTIIDFSLSRLTSGADNCTIFKNLAEDPTLFAAAGLDKGGDYQFDIYRMMKRANGNSWEEFLPKTNVFWLHYMLAKMTTDVYYKVRLVGWLIFCREQMFENLVHSRS